MYALIRANPEARLGKLRLPMKAAHSPVEVCGWERVPQIWCHVTKSLLWIHCYCLLVVVRGWGSRDENSNSKPWVGREIGREIRPGIQTLEVWLKDYMN